MDSKLLWPAAVLILLTLGSLPKCLLAEEDEGPSADEYPALVSAALAEFESTATAEEVKSCLDKNEDFYSLGLRIKDSLTKMLEGRNSTMRIGLGKLGRAVKKLGKSASKKCGNVGKSAEVLTSLGEKLEGFGTDKAFIKYQKKQSLVAGGYDIHTSLNAFIGAWKKSPSIGKDVGESLGKLFKSLKDEPKGTKAAEL
eukprot:TRINITY_DN31699_c0_g1_i1.p1 TRINITY_DN31699_c0_g1~~TRINITY_DN31699_c0_g1_i1.p1  ORF type:complete len:222 (-),score=61.81 TRINITY_DN31699_c0_g1_i1:136-729(-)